VQVRQAGEEDVDALARLRAAWRGQEPSGKFLAAFHDWFRREQPSRWWWLATNDQAALGMVNLKLFDRMPSPDRPPSRWGYLSNLFVAPEWRGQGLGGALVAALISRARAEGLARVVLSPSELSIPLYARHGFRSADDLLILPLVDD